MAKGAMTCSRIMGLFPCRGLCRGTTSLHPLPLPQGTDSYVEHVVGDLLEIHC